MLQRKEDPPAAPARTHLHAIDVLRLLTVLGVIVVHATSLLLPPGVASGAVLSVLHATREIFLVLSAAVLAHTAGNRRLRVRRFWRRRYPLVAVPYVVWSAIYLIADGHLGDPGALPGRLAWDLLTAGARFHLYFLLLTLQLYLVFPWVLGVVRTHRRCQTEILIGALVWQLGFTAAVHYRLPVPSPLSAWLDHPGSWLPSYAGYVVIGVLIGLRLEVFLAWSRTHGRLIATVVLASVAVTLVGFVVDLQVLGMGPLRASEVFRPAVVVDSLALFAGLLALGMAVVERAGTRTLRRLEGSSGVSFGVYLAHPLVIQGAMAASGVLGLNGPLGRLPAVWAVAAVVLVFAPITFGVTAVAVRAVTGSPLSLALTGRPSRGRPEVVAAVVIPGAGPPPELVAARRPLRGHAEPRPTRVRTPWARPVLAATALVSCSTLVAVSASGIWPSSGSGDRHPAAARRAGVRRGDAAREARPGPDGGHGGTTHPVAGRPSPTPARLTAAQTGVAPSWVTTDVTLDYDGLARSYLIVRPRRRSRTRLPVLMVLHGRSVTPAFEEVRTGFPSVTGPAILLYPAGYGESWDAGLCCSIAAADHVDDVGFLSTVVRDVLRSEPDAGRVYLAGYSNGGRMALRLACVDAGLFAGVAVYAATASDPCPHPSPVSALIVASTGDPELTIGPGGTPQTIGTFVQPTVTAQAQEFVGLDRCAPASAPRSAGAVTITGWTCARHRRVDLDLYQGGSHAWPVGGGATPSGGTLIWRWFESIGA